MTNHEIGRMYRLELRNQISSNWPRISDSTASKLIKTVYILHVIPQGSQTNSTNCTFWTLIIYSLFLTSCSFVLGKKNFAFPNKIENVWKWKIQNLHVVASWAILSTFFICKIVTGSNAILSASVEVEITSHLYRNLEVKKLNWKKNKQK